MKKLESFSFGGRTFSLSFELFESLNDDQTKSFIEILNNAKFPLRSRSRSEIQSLIKEVEVFSKTDTLDSFFGSFLMPLLFYSDDYEEFKTNIDFAFKSSEAESDIKKRAKYFINSLKYLGEYFEDRRLESYKVRGNIYFRSIDFTCNLRARYKKDYDYESMSIEDYYPEVLDFVPLASLEFILGGESTPIRLAFDADDKDLDQIISNLLAAQKSLKDIREFIREKRNEKEWC